jgi:hypothetical protein
MAACRDESEDSRVAKVRRLLAQRILGRGGKVWAGPSKGAQSCFVCAMTIPAGEYEFELDSSPDPQVLCRPCYVVWDAERRESGRDPK